MTTLMSWGNSDGIKGRCDDKCHNATGLDCDCMCGGRFHGRARDGSLDKAVRQHWSEIEKKARARAEREGYDITFTNGLPLEKMPLFKPK